MATSPKKHMKITMMDVIKSVRKPSAPKGTIFKSKKAYTRKNDKRVWED